MENKCCEKCKWKGKIYPKTYPCIDPRCICHSQEASKEETEWEARERLGEKPFDNPQPLASKECEHKDWECDGNGKTRPSGLKCVCECPRCMTPQPLKTEWENESGLLSGGIKNEYEELDNLVLEAQKSAYESGQKGEQVVKDYRTKFKNLLLAQREGLRKKIEGKKKVIRQPMGRGGSAEYEVNRNQEYMKGGYNQCIDDILNLLKDN